MIDWRKVFLVFGVPVLLLLAVIVAHHQLGPHFENVDPKRCSKIDCAELDDTTTGDQIATFSYYRLGPQGCIYYLHAGKSHEHCGGYVMGWIGPGQPPGKVGGI